MQSILMNLAAEALQILIPRLSDFVREKLVELVHELDERAAETENEWDDQLVDLLKAAIQAPEDVSPSPEK